MELIYVIESSLSFHDHCWLFALGTASQWECDIVGGDASVDWVNLMQSKNCLRPLDLSLLKLQVRTYLRVANF